MHCSLSMSKFIHVILYLCLNNMVINSILRCKLWSLLLLTTISILMHSILNKACHREFCNSNTIKKQYKINVCIWFKIWTIQLSKWASKLRILEIKCQIVLSPPRVCSEAEGQLTNFRAPPWPSQHPTVSFCASFSIKTESLRSFSSTLKKTLWSSCPSSKGIYLMAGDHLISSSKNHT